MKSRLVSRLRHINQARSRTR